MALKILFNSNLFYQEEKRVLPAQYGAAGSFVLATTQETQQETVELGALGSVLAAVGLTPLDPDSAGAGAVETSIMSTTSHQETQPETVHLVTSGPATVGVNEPGAGAGGSPLITTTQQGTQPETVGPLRSGPVRRSRVVSRLRGLVMLGLATVGLAPTASSRLQTSDLLALEETKQWEVSGK